MSRTNSRMHVIKAVLTFSFSFRGRFYFKDFSRWCYISSRNEEWRLKEQRAQQSILSLPQPMAYFWVQFLAFVSYLLLSVLYMWAISGTKGSSGLGSVRREQIESNTWFRWHPYSGHWRKVEQLIQDLHDTNYKEILNLGNSQCGAPLLL